MGVTIHVKLLLIGQLIENNEFTLRRGNLIGQKPSHKWDNSCKAAAYRSVKSTRNVLNFWICDKISSSLGDERTKDLFG